MSNRRRHVIVPDPIAGKIELPNRLVKIIEEPAVRRMMFIRQLGLKAYIDFPGAIHTRYSHALGAMHLAGKITDLLIQKMDEIKNSSIIKESLLSSKNDLIAAGFLHDIAHGPFSHAVDFAMKEISGKSHEDLAEEIILNELPKDLANWINEQQVIKLIQGKHDYPFLSQIISGPLDIDKLDYLLRDAHHVGLKYSFDLDYFLGSYTILGDRNCLNKCKLGLENSAQARVTTEIFLVIWKSMYDLVYFVQDSRIAEKMLEKAVLLGKDEKKIAEKFNNTKSFLTLNDDELLNILTSLTGKPADLVSNIKAGKVYDVIIDTELDQTQFQLTTAFVEALKKPEKANALSDTISKQFNEKNNKKEYAFICDIITSKVPSEIAIDDQDKETGEYTELRQRSRIIGAMQSQSRIKVYCDPTIKQEAETEKINTTLKEIIEGIKIDS
jgi:uncharacterized protein